MRRQQYLRKRKRSSHLTLDGATAQHDLPSLYSELASWWPLLSSPADYAEEAAFIRQTLSQECAASPRTLLELGSGGGNNASHLKSHFQMTLVDRSAEMLAVSQRLNPDCEHVLGDMRTVRLNRLFDAVLIHDAIMYMLSLADLLQALRTAFAHLHPGGAALFMPDHTRETFQPGSDHGGHDGEDRALRYLEWSYDPDPDDHLYISDFVYLLRDGGDRVSAVLDRHVMGLFSEQEWLEQLSAAGFKPHSLTDPEGRVDFVGLRPLDSSPPVLAAQDEL